MTLCIISRVLLAIYYITVCESRKEGAQLWYVAAEAKRERYGAPTYIEDRDTYLPTALISRILLSPSKFRRSLTNLLGPLAVLRFIFARTCLFLS